VDTNGCKTKKGGKKKSEAYSAKESLSEDRRWVGGLHQFPETLYRRGRRSAGGAIDEKPGSHRGKGKVLFLLKKAVEPRKCGRQVLGPVVKILRGGREFGKGAFSIRTSSEKGERTVQKAGKKESGASEKERAFI